jgi:DTW domain-containing protein YfiP
MSFSTNSHLMNGYAAYKAKCAQEKVFDLHGFDVDGEPTVIDASSDLPKEEKMVAARSFGILKKASSLVDRKAAKCVRCWLLPRDCLCDKLEPVQLGLPHHKYTVLLHHKEFGRASNTGKLLHRSLMHGSTVAPDAEDQCSVLVLGIPSHDALLRERCNRYRSGVLFPGADSLSVAHFLRGDVVPSVAKRSTDDILTDPVSKEGKKETDGKKTERHTGGSSMFPLACKHCDCDTLFHSSNVLIKHLASKCQGMKKHVYDFACIECGEHYNDPSMFTRRKLKEATLKVVERPNEQFKDPEQLPICLYTDAKVKCRVCTQARHESAFTPLLDSSSSSSSSSLPSSALSADSKQADPACHFIVLDATWSQAQGMNKDAILSALPRVAIDPSQHQMHKSLFGPLRKQTASSRICTLEAVCALLIEAHRGTESEAESLRAASNLLENLKLLVDSLLRQGGKKTIYGKI